MSMMDSAIIICLKIRYIISNSYHFYSKVLGDRNKKKKRNNYMLIKNLIIFNLGSMQHKIKGLECFKIFN